MNKINLLRLKEYGTVAEVKQDVLHVTGLTNCMNGQLVRIGERSNGLVLGFGPEYVLVLLVDESAGIRPGEKVVSVMDEFRIPVGVEFVGRRVNALGHAIDGGGPVREDARYPIFGVAPSVLERIPLTEAMQTGTKIIDMMKPVGRGQRMLILGDRMTGKTAIGVDAILSQKGRDVICIYCSIGKSEASLNKVINAFDKGGVWGYTSIVAATASAPMGQQYLAPYVATSIGEYFMYEKHADVLIVFDDFTKHAWAYRQISLLLERAPGRDAYPGDIFYIHSQLVERAGKLNQERGSGSMTHLPIVETLQGDVAGYIPSNIVSMTDGQIYMSSQLFGEGFKPAIDMGLSVSRIGNKVQWPAMRKATGMLQLEFVRYKELERLTRIRAGASAEVEGRLLRGRVIEAVLKQDENHPVALEDQVMILYGLNHGLLDKLDPSEVPERITEFIKGMHTELPEVVHELVRRKELSDAIKQGLDAQIDKFRPAAAP